MFATLKGTITSKSDNAVVVEVQNVGYLVFMPANELATVKLGQEILLYTHLSVKEDALDLYGSVREETIKWFRLLLNVKGIGPKSALAILSLAEPRDLALAIRRDKSIILINLGLGKKTAERIVLELKHKASELGGELEGVTDSVLDMESEALQALESLGYNREQARTALKEAAGEDVGSKVKNALKILGKR